MSLQHIAFPIMLTAGILFSHACDGIAGPDHEDFVVRVDSLQVVSAGSATDSLRIRLFGVVGPDGCHALQRIDADAVTEMLEITVYGRRKVGDATCTQLEVRLDEIVSAPPPWVPPFSIIVHQPDGSTLRHEVGRN